MPYIVPTRGRSVLRSISSPVEIDGLFGWYDGADIAALWQDDARTVPVTSDGDVSGAWDDKSGNAWYFTQSNSSKKPLYKVNVQNGLSSLYFDGLNDFLFRILALPQPFTLFGVTTLDPLAVNDGTVRTVFFGWSNTNHFARTTGGTKKFQMNSGSWGGAIEDDSNCHVWCVRFDGASSYIRQDGVEKYAGDPGSNNSIRLYLGANSSGTQPWWGYFHEVAIYQPSPPIANVLLIEAYLNNKWAAY